MTPQPSIDAYIATFPKEVQVLLIKIRKLIAKTVPGAQECISYGIPTFDLNGKHLVHFAGFKKHIGFFPTSSPIPVFKHELTDYKTSKGTVQFPLDKPIPFELIKRMVEWRVREASNK